MIRSVIVMSVLFIAQASFGATFVCTSLEGSPSSGPATVTSSEIVDRDLNLTNKEGLYIKDEGNSGMPTVLVPVYTKEYGDAFL